MTPRGFGPYEVVGPLGRGGMGRVFEVRHPDQPGRRLALKLVPVDPAHPTAARRFEREAQLLARVRHPGVVAVHAVGQSPEGQWLVMELVEGRPLAARVEEGPLPPAAAALLVARVADGVAALHAQGIVHRDLKPENVLLRPDGSPVVIDLGLARAGDVERLTRSGTLAGSPVYMAPEQVDGTSPERLDARVDVWALGALFYALVNGAGPFEDSRTLPEAVHRITSQEPRWPALPAPLLAVLQRALSKRPAARQAHAGALAGELRAACAGLDPARGPRPVGLVAVGALLLVVAALGALLLLLPPPAPAGPSAAVASASPVATSAGPPAPPARAPWRRLDLTGARATGAAFLPGGRLLTWARLPSATRLEEWALPLAGAPTPTGRRWQLRESIQQVAVAETGRVALLGAHQLFLLETGRRRPPLALEIRPEPLARNPAALAISARGDLVAVGQGRSPGPLAVVFRVEGESLEQVLYYGLDEGAGVDQLLVGPQELVVASSGKDEAVFCPVDVVPLAEGAARERVPARFGVTALARDAAGGLWVGSSAHLLRYLAPGARELGTALEGRGVPDPLVSYATRAHAGPVGAIRCLGPARLVTISSGPDPEYQGPQRKAGRASELRVWSRDEAGRWTNTGGVGEWPAPLRTLEVSLDGQWLVVGHGAAVEVWAVEALPTLGAGEERLPDYQQVVDRLGR